MPGELHEQLINAVRMESGKNLVRRLRVMQLLTQMETEELNVRLLKGYAVADCYQYPECRDSTDNVQVVQDLKADKKGVSNDTLKNETLDGIYQ